MTMREQMALFLFLFLFSGVGLLWVIDTVAETLDEYLSREKIWRAIEVRCSMERHPSNQVTVYDWEDER